MKEKRKGNKFVTVITGLLANDIELEVAKKFFAQKFDCSCSKGEGDELKKAQDAFVVDVEKAIVKDEPKEEEKKDEEKKDEAGTVEEKKEEAAATKARKMRLMRARKLAMASKIKKTKPVIRKSYKH